MSQDIEEKTIQQIAEFVGEWLSNEANLSDGLDVDTLVTAVQAKYPTIDADHIRAVLELMFSAGEEGEFDDFPWGEGEGGFPFGMFGEGEGGFEFGGF